MSHTAGRAHFRPDIEGLRAIAVLAVLLYHVRLPGFSGGFIGVDVFYVISGFLITGLLRREIVSSGRIDFVAFYARRTRRLLPAALLVIALTVVASAFILSSLQFPDVAGDGAAAALYVFNIREAMAATDYLASEAAPSPLLHYWSLSVEEQFYLVWPALIFLGARVMGIGRVAWLVVGVLAGSFALSLWWTDTAAPWAFFSLPTRAWELALGALIALRLLRLPERTEPAIASAVGWTGLALVLIGVFAIDGAVTPYPGTAALLPVVGTALLILAGERATATPSRWLATAAPRFIGRISYSLYLWHWPLLILVPAWLGRDEVLLRLGLAVAAIGLAAASTILFEDPIREGRALPMRPARSVLAMTGSSVVVAVVALALGGLLPLPSLTPEGPTVALASSIPSRESPSPHVSRIATVGPSASVVDASPSAAGQPSTAPTRAAAPPSSPPARPTTGPLVTVEPTRSPAPAPTPEPSSPPLADPTLAGPLPDDLRPPLRSARDDLPVSYDDGCHLDYATTESPACAYAHRASETTVVLFGDSHAAQWLPTLQALADDRDWRVENLTKSACPPTRVPNWNPSLKREYRECGAWVTGSLERIAAERPAIVFVGAARDYQLIVDGERRGFEEALDAWRAGYEDVLVQLAASAGRVVLLGDTPRNPEDPLECLARSGLIEACSSSRETMVDPGYADLEAGVAAASGADLVVPSDWLCPGEVCPLVFGPRLAYRDIHHLTASFAASLAPQLAWELDHAPGRDDAS